MDKIVEPKDKDNIGLGVDIVDVQRMKKIIEDGSNFVDFTFTKNEIKYCSTYPTRSAEHFATHFAGKEAVLKALGNGFCDGVGPKDVEILHNNKGKPYVELHDKAKEIADSLNILRIAISLSFTKNEAVSVAIALFNEDNLQSKIINKSTDPTVELTKKFKEAKKLLDEEYKEK